MSTMSGLDGIPDFVQALFNQASYKKRVGADLKPIPRKQRMSFGFPKETRRTHVRRG